MEKKKQAYSISSREAPKCISPRNLHNPALRRLDSGSLFHHELLRSKRSVKLSQSYYSAESKRKSIVIETGEKEKHKERRPLEERAMAMDMEMEMVGNGVEGA